MRRSGFQNCRPSSQSPCQFLFSLQAGVSAWLRLGSSALEESISFQFLEIFKVASTGIDKIIIAIRERLWLSSILSRKSGALCSENNFKVSCIARHINISESVAESIHLIFNALIGVINSRLFCPAAVKPINALMAEFDFITENLHLAYKALGPFLICNIFFVFQEFKIFLSP